MLQKDEISTSIDNIIRKKRKYKKIERMFKVIDLIIFYSLIPICFCFNFILLLLLHYS